MCEKVPHQSSFAVQAVAPPGLHNLQEGMDGLFGVSSVENQVDVREHFMNVVKRGDIHAHLDKDVIDVTTWLHLAQEANSTSKDRPDFLIVYDTSSIQLVYSREEPWF